MLIDSIDVRKLSGQDLQDYYQTYSDLVLFSTEFSVGTDFYSDNLSKILFYRKKLRESILDKNSLSAACNQADLLAWNGEDRKALTVLQKYVENHPDLDGRAYSIVYSTMAFFYSKVGDRQMRKKCLLLSAISDVKCCIRENTSIRELASVLFGGSLKLPMYYLHILDNQAHCTLIGTSNTLTFSRISSGSSIP